VPALVVLSVVAVLAAPLAVPRDVVALRTLAAYMAVGIALRVIGLARDGAGGMAARFFTARVTRARPEVQTRRWLEGLALGGVSVALFIAARALGRDEAPYASLREGARAAIAVVALLAMAESSERTIRAGAALFGYALPPLHRAPARSRTVAELWGRRWNLWLGAWLRDHVYSPLARAGAPRRGVLAAFAVSALVHVVPTAVAVGAGAAIAIGAFFIAQGAIVVLESRARVRTWPPSFARVASIAAFAATAPLFGEPFLRSLGL
jgi:hypothetical protein